MRDRVTWRWLPLVLATAIALVGYYGPWVPHRAAGLVVLGSDLAEYVKFLPEPDSQRIANQRELFYLPLLAGSVTASLLASRRSLRRPARILLALAAIPLALAMLPPAWTPVSLSLPEFRLQVILILTCLLLIPAVALTCSLHDRLVLGLLAVVALCAALWPLWGFLQVRPAIAELYRRPLALGWGVWLTVIGFLAVALFAVAEALRPRATR